MTSADVTVANVSETLSGMGRRLREIRLERGISLRELARRLELSPSAVSKIETGKMQPSVHTLHALVAEFDLSVDEVFTEQRSPSTHSALAPRPWFVVQRAEDRPAVALASGVVLARLMSSIGEAAEVVEATHAPGGSGMPSSSLGRTDGHEFGYILSGVLQVVLGADSVMLSAGDSITLLSSGPHRLVNDGPEHVRAIWIVRGSLGLDLGPADHGGETR